MVVDGHQALETGRERRLGVGIRLARERGELVEHEDVLKRRLPALAHAIDELGVVRHTSYLLYIPLLPIIAAPARTRGRWAASSARVGLCGRFDEGSLPELDAFAKGHLSSAPDEYVLDSMLV